MIDPQTHDVLQDKITQSVVAAMGMQDFAPEEQAALLAEMGEVVSDAVMVAILKAIPEEKREEFAHALSKGEMDTVKKLMTTYLIDADSFVAKAVQEEVAFLREELSKVAVHA